MGNFDLNAVDDFTRVTTPNHLNNARHTLRVAVLNSHALSYFTANRYLCNIFNKNRNSFYFFENNFTNVVWLCD